MKCLIHISKILTEVIGCHSKTRACTERNFIYGRSETDITAVGTYKEPAHRTSDQLQQHLQGASAGSAPQTARQKPDFENTARSSFL